MDEQNHEPTCQLNSDQILIRTLSEQEANTLYFIREEEKMARDVYNALFDLWNTQIFTNIAASEQKHMDSVKVFLDAYQLPDPASNEVGQFNNSVLQDLYDKLIATGSQSELAAFNLEKSVAHGF